MSDITPRPRLTETVTFREREDILQRFDAAAEAKGLRRADVLRWFVRQWIDSAETAARPAQSSAPAREAA